MIPVKDGDVFASGADVVVHQVNCQGVMGSGVALQVKKLYPSVYTEYKKLCDLHIDETESLLGTAQFCHIGDNKYICNLFGQDRYGYDGSCYSSMDALTKALKFVNDRFAGKSVAIPYLMSCHRGGGNWDEVSEKIEFCLCDCHVTFYRYRGD